MDVNGRGFSDFALDEAKLAAAVVVRPGAVRVPPRTREARVARGEVAGTVEGKRRSPFKVRVLGWGLGFRRGLGYE